MKKVGSDALRNLPVVGTLLGLVAIAVLGLAYWGNVTSRERYLQSRNFRLLGHVAQQTQTMLYDSEQIVRRTLPIAARAADPAAADATRTRFCPGPQPPDRPISNQPLDKETAARWASELICKLQPAGPEGKKDEHSQRRIAPIELWRGEATIQPSPAGMSEIAEQFKQYRTRVSGVGSDLRFEWTAADTGLSKLSFQLPAAALFAAAFDQARWGRAFSTMALATPDGRIVFAVGPQAAELKASRIAALLPGAPEKDASNLMRFASAISNEPVRIAGIDYRMFTQPCCRADALTSAVNSSTPGLVVIGLSEADALRSLSLAISPVLVLGGAAFVMLCLVGWGFLKCSLMGLQQRLGRHDVINLLASGLFGVALITILLLTAGVYSRLSADVDVHLQHLALAVNEKFTRDIEGAARQLHTMVDRVRTHKCSQMTGSQPGPGKLPNDPCQTVPQPVVESGYKDFITFAMVDKSGLQAVKTAFTDATRTIVNVNARPYYQHVVTREQLWSLPPPNQTGGVAERLCPDGCYLEYISSWNTGRPQGVIAMPTGIDRLPVATLSIPMHALLAPVLPPGFEFAVVDSAGIVQFHSDPQRNGHENLLLETDQNSRLRSLLGARSAGTFNTMYWAYPYRGYVRPTRIPDWSIVVLHAKQTSRALVLEWFTVAMLLAALYTFGWVVAMLLSLWRGASWLWPDPLRRHWYVPLGCLAVVATAGWLAIAWTKPVGVTAIAGIVIPILTWAVVYLVLAVRPAGAGEVKQWAEMCRGYRFAGTALFLLTAAVPAASFYAISVDRHIEAFVKERQIGLARSINGVVACKDVDPDDEIGGDNKNEHVVRYDDKDHDGAVTCVAEAEQTNTAESESDLHEAFENFVPYFTSASVALRELMHEKSQDNTWRSRRNEAGELELRFRSGDPTLRLQVSTALPAVVGVRGTGQNQKRVLVAVAALVMLAAVLGAAYFVIAFLFRRVLLADIVEPIRRGHRIVTQVGQHLQVICRDPAQVAKHVNDLHLLGMTSAASGTGARALEDIRREVSEAPASQRIGISDLQASPENVSLLEKKLEIVEAVMDMSNQTVLLFTDQTARDLGAWVRERCESSADRDRWSKLIARLRVTELPARSATTLAERWKHYLHNLLQGWREEFSSHWNNLRAPLEWRAQLLEREGQSDPKIDEIATELQNSTAFVDGSLTRDQILEEIEESADPHYREIWKQRSEEERVLLEHVARHGLASAASRRVVRKLLAARVLRKDPELRLMSESFRRFVLEPERRQEVAALEKQAAPSMWDRVRVPLAMSGVLALLFLLVTQREALDTTLSMALGVTAAGGTLVKLTSLLAQLGVKGDPKANV